MKETWNWNTLEMTVVYCKMLYRILLGGAPTTLELRTRAQGAVTSSPGHITVPEHNKETAGNASMLGKVAVYW
jgi:hypothetical protein